MAKKGKKKSKSNKVLCKELLEKHGNTAEVTEYFAWGRLHDLFGIIDVMAVRQDGFIRFVQAFSTKTTGSRYSEHRDKIKADPKILDFINRILESENNTFEFWGLNTAKKTIPDDYFIVWIYSKKNGGIDGEPDKYRYFFDGRIEPLR